MMGKSGCFVTMKYLLVFLNLILLVVGLVGVGGFGWALQDGRLAAGAGGPAAASAYRAGLSVLSGWAVLLAAAAICGLCAAGGSRGALLAAFCLLSVCVVGQSAATWWATAHKPQLRQALTDHLENSVMRQYGREPRLTSLIDTIQAGLRCCGAKGPRDYESSVFSGRGEDGVLDLSVVSSAGKYRVPASCCRPDVCDENQELGLTDTGSDSVWTGGCLAPLLGYLVEAGWWALSADALLIALQLLCVLLTVGLLFHYSTHHQYKA